ATHGSAPKYKGQNKVNPTAVILSGMLMLRHLGEVEAGNRLEKAVADVIKEGKKVTYDLKADRNDPTAVGTREMAQAICAKLKQARLHAPPLIGRPLPLHVVLIFDTANAVDTCPPGLVATEHHHEFVVAAFEELCLQLLVVGVLLQDADDIDPAMRLIRRDT